MYRVQKKKIINLCKHTIIAGIKEEMEKEMTRETKEKRTWVRDWVARRGEDVPLYKEVATEDREKFFTDFRMYPENFNQLLGR